MGFIDQNLFLKVWLNKSTKVNSLPLWAYEITGEDDMQWLSHLCRLHQTPPSQLLHPTAASALLRQSLKAGSRFQEPLGKSHNISTAAPFQTNNVKDNQIKRLRWLPPSGNGELCEWTWESGWDKQWHSLIDGEDVLKINSLDVTSGRSGLELLFLSICSSLPTEAYILISGKTIRRATENQPIFLNFGQDASREAPG